MAAIKYQIMLHQDADSAQMLGYQGQRFTPE